MFASASMIVVIVRRSKHNYCHKLGFMYCIDCNICLSINIMNFLLRYETTSQSQSLFISDKYFSILPWLLHPQ